MKKIQCFFGYHDLYVVRKLLDNSKLFGCRKCPGYWGVMKDGYGYKILKFGEEMYEMYSTMGLRGLKKYISKKSFSFWWRA